MFFCRKIFTIFEKYYLIRAFYKAPNYIGLFLKRAKAGAGPFLCLEISENYSLIFCRKNRIKSLFIFDKMLKS